MEPTTLEEVRQAASRVDAVCLLAPIPTPENLGDGYIRRIDTIDNTILKSFVRIYLMGDRPDLRRIQAEKEDERRYFLQFDSRSFWQRRQIFDLIRRSGRLYIHSVYRFVAGPVSRRLLKVLDLPGIRVVWDVHGAVPEEIEQTGDIPITLRGGGEAVIPKKQRHRVRHHGHGGASPRQVRGDRRPDAAAADPPGYDRYGSVCSAAGVGKAHGGVCRRAAGLAVRR